MTKTTRGDAGGGYRAVSIALFLCLFAAQAALITMSPVLADAASDLHVSTAAAGQLRTITGLAAGITALTLGAVAGPQFAAVSGTALAGYGVPTLAAPFFFSALLLATAGLGLLTFLRPDPAIVAGTAGAAGSTPIQNQPMNIQLQLGAKDQLAHLLNRAGVLGQNTDASGYSLMTQSFIIGGTPANPDSSQLWQMLGSAAARAAAGSLLK